MLLIIILLLDLFEEQSRLCQNNGVWSEVDDSTCPSQGIAQLWERVSQ